MKWILTFAGIIYTVMLGLIGIGMIGACGVGTSLFAALAFFPFGVGLLYWPLLGYLLPSTSQAYQRNLCLGILSLQGEFLAACCVKLCG